MAQRISSACVICYADEVHHAAKHAIEVECVGLNGTAPMPTEVNGVAGHGGVGTELLGA